MKLKEIFEQLSYGELSQLSLGGNGQGTIDEANLPKILAHVNLGLTALYKRFPLKESRVMLELQPNQIAYPLLSKFAVNSRKSNEKVRYLLDTTMEPFTDDILKIKRIYTDTGYEMSLNDNSDVYTVTTPTSQSIRVPEDMVDGAISVPDYLKTANLEIVYQANHPQLLVTGGDRSEVELPHSHLEPLLLFIASRVNSPMGLNNEFNSASKYAVKYEQACQQLEMLNLRVDQGSQNDRLQKNGWV